MVKTGFQQFLDTRDIKDVILLIAEVIGLAVHERFEEARKEFRPTTEELKEREVQNG